MPFRIPILHLDERMQPAPGHAGRPIIRLGFTAPRHAAGPEQVRSEAVFALIDTGADLTYAYPSLLDRAGCPVIETVTVHGATGANTAAMRLATLVFPDHEFGLTLEVVELHTQASPAPYPLVLGRTFLTRGHLQLDYVRNQHWFDYHLEHERGD